MADLFKKIQINVTDEITNIFKSKLEESVKSKTNVLWAMAINQKGYEDVSVLVIVRPDSTEAILKAKFNLSEKNGRKFYIATITEGKCDIVEVK